MQTQGISPRLTHGKQDPVGYTVWNFEFTRCFAGGTVILDMHHNTLCYCCCYLQFQQNRRPTIWELRKVFRQVNLCCWRNLWLCRRVTLGKNTWLVGKRRTRKGNIYSVWTACTAMNLWTHPCKLHFRVWLSTDSVNGSIVACLVGAWVRLMTSVPRTFSILVYCVAVLVTSDSIHDIVTCSVYWVSKHSKSACSRHGNCKLLLNFFSLSSSSRLHKVYLENCSFCLQTKFRNANVYVIM